jgi:hypothetical protein
MRDFFIKMLAQKVGLPKVPETQQEFFTLLSNNPTLKEDFKKIEEAGLIKRGDDGNLNVIDQARVDSLVQEFIMKFLKS